jgi:hypothetical protein
MYRHGETTRRVLRSLVPVICPPEAEAIGDQIVEHMAGMFDAMPPLMRRGLVAGLATYDLGALPRYLRRAHALPAAKATAYFESWAHGPTPVHRQLAQALKQLMSLSCYDQPEMMEAVGYRPAGWMREVTKKRLATYSDDIRAQERRILEPDPLRPAASKKEVA